MLQQFDLKDIKPLTGESTNPDLDTAKELQDAIEKQPDYQKEIIEQLKAETKRLEIYNNSLENERISRIWYGIIVSSFVIGYIIAVLFLVAKNLNKPNLDDRIIITLLATTSINIIGLLAAVVRFVFSGHHHTAITYRKK